MINDKCMFYVLHAIYIIRKLIAHGPALGMSHEWVGYSVITAQFQAPPRPALIDKVLLAGDSYEDPSWAGCGVEWSTSTNTMANNNFQ